MKSYLLLVLAICVSATPVMASRTVYLKEGGTISAKSVWRTKDRIHVLVNRDTLTEFPASEIDLKRTFVRKHRAARKQAPAPGASKEATVSQVGAVVSQKAGNTKTKLQLPVMPKLTERNPESLVPKGEEGTIRKHKKEMTERIGE